jgi:ubiquinone biosynthesis protein COQ9
MSKRQSKEPGTTGEAGQAGEEGRQELCDRLLEAALAHAPFEGWGRRTLVHAAHDAGIDRATMLRLCPGGGSDLLAMLDDWADRKMLAAVSAADLARLPVRRRVARLIRARLEALGPHREAVRRAIVAGLVPTGTLAASRSIWRTCDRVWQAVALPAEADRGIGRVTRRATLVGVLTTTTLFWLDDRSEHSDLSWAFLDRRIDDALRLGKVTAQAGEVVDRLRRPFARGAA